MSEPGGQSRPLASWEALRQPGAYLVHARGQDAGRPGMDQIGPEDAERIRLHGDEVAAAAVLEHVTTAPLLGGTRVVVVGHAERMDRRELRALRDGVRAYPVRDGWLVLWDESDEAEAAATLGEASPFTVIRLAPSTTSEVTAWVERAVASAGVRLTPAARSLLKLALEQAPARAAGELEKLKTYGASELAEEELMALMSRDLLELACGSGPAPGSRGDFRHLQAVEAALEGRMDRALSLIRQLAASGIPPAAIWRELSRQALQLYDLSEHLLARYGPASRWPEHPDLPATAARMSPYVLGRKLAEIRRWGPDGLLRVLEWAAQADYDSKRGGLEPPEALLRLLARMSAHQGPAGA